MGRDVNRESSVYKPGTLKIQPNFFVFEIQPEIFWILPTLQNVVHVRLPGKSSVMFVQFRRIRKA